MDPFEIQVYDGKVNEVHENSLENHLNKGDDAHLTFEFAHGMTPYWELGAYLQTALNAQNQYRYGGAKLRTKFVNPTVKPWHLGVNFEIANIPTEFEEDRWGGEMRPIIGYEWKRLLILANPILEFGRVNGPIRTPSFSPAVKIGYDTLQGYRLGFEYYASFEALNALKSLDESEQYLFGAYDLLNSNLELNVAVGFGFGAPSVNSIVKVIFGFPL